MGENNVNDYESNVSRSRKEATLCRFACAETATNLSPRCRKHPRLIAETSTHETPPRAALKTLAKHLETVCPANANGCRPPSSFASAYWEGSNEASDRTELALQRGAPKSSAGPYKAEKRADGDPRIKACTVGDGETWRKEKTGHTNVNRASGERASETVGGG